MFKILDHVRTRLSVGPGVEQHASGKAGVPRSSEFDHELARLRQCWVESHRVFSATPSSERNRTIQAVHANANAYFDYLDRIRVEDHVPMQVRHGYPTAGATPTRARTSLRLAPSR